MEQSNFEQFIELLNQKGIIRKMQLTMKIMPNSLSGDLGKALNQAGVATMLNEELRSDANLRKAYNMAANEMMFAKTMEIVDLKKDVQFTPQEMVVKGISEALLGGVFKELDDIQKNIEEQIRKVKGEGNE